MTAANHSARSSRGKLLHSRRTEGFEQGIKKYAVADCPKRVDATRARLTNQRGNITGDERDVPCDGGRLLAGREQRGRGGNERSPMGFNPGVRLVYIPGICTLSSVWC